MALANASVVQTALKNIYTALTDNKLERGSRSAVLQLAALTGYLSFLFADNQTDNVVIDIALTADSDDADVAAFVAAEATMSAKTIYRVTTATYDFTDNAMGTAKNSDAGNSTVAIGDIFAITDAGTGVVYLGNTPIAAGYGVVFDNVGESDADFKAIS